MIRRVDAYRLHALAGDGRRVAYAVVDAFGWVVFARRGGAVEQVARFTDTTTLRRYLYELAMSG